MKIILLLSVFISLALSQKLALSNVRTLIPMPQYPQPEFYPCPEKYVVTYIWLGTKIPDKYKEFIQRCAKNVNFLSEKHYEPYIKRWNQAQPNFQIPTTPLPIEVRADLFRKVYLWFEGGMYADFDTMINQTCFDGIYTNKIIFTNTWGGDTGRKIPQENFIWVRQKNHPLIRRWLIAQIFEQADVQNRWDQCRMEQCFFIQCQQHFYNRTWKKKLL